MIHYLTKPSYVHEAFVRNRINHFMAVEKNVANEDNTDQFSPARNCYQLPMQLTH